MQLCGVCSGQGFIGGDICYHCDGEGIADGVVVTKQKIIKKNTKSHEEHQQERQKEMSKINKKGVERDGYL